MRGFLIVIVANCVLAAASLRSLFQSNVAIYKDKTCNNHVIKAQDIQLAVTRACQLVKEKKRGHRKRLRGNTENQSSSSLLEEYTLPRGKLYYRYPLNSALQPPRNKYTLDTYVIISPRCKFHSLMYHNVYAYLGLALKGCT
ncbi:BgTH12-07162 [Blumeria graminis f. sp. triticale]|uniref:BgTH12-07162 n=1 Tax=Blumeria graminis f. sp. triticale TaxID=1689686 RepID=A0A9W4DEB7_BLUGR|nr:BgTH12-07162 [Blumeria graminis f. sp. triticale]